jgi:hypothetical protein
MNDESYDIDELLKVTVSKESQTTRVESVIQDADSFSSVAGSSATARFTLPEKGQMLAPNGRLLFKATFSGYSGGTNRMLSPPRFGGALSMIREARLFCGSLIERNTLAGHKINIENNALPYDSQNEVVDVLLGSNHGYTYSADGTIQLTDDINDGTPGARNLTADASATAEYSIPIDSLFSCLKDVMIPTFLKNPIVIEIDFDITFANGAKDVVISSGDGAAAAANSLSVVRPRLDLDYIVMDEDIVDAFRDKVMGGMGQTYSFRNNVLIQKVMEATADSTTQEKDMEIGLAGQRVMKLFIEKQLNYDNSLLKGLRSDGLLAEELQLFINNQNLYDRTVDRLSDMYVYLGQAVGTSYKVLNGAYELVGELGANNLMTNAVKLPESAGSDNDSNIVQANLQGRMRWLGVNLGQSRVEGMDNPMNSLKIGQSPIVIRLQRSIPGAGVKTARGETNNAQEKTAVNINVFAETVKLMTIQNGEVMISSL